MEEIDSLGEGGPASIGEYCVSAFLYLETY
jgi:hypothetical protein